VIVCERCGSQNADGESFCGACGAFLEWEGAPAEPAVHSGGSTPTPNPAVPVAPVSPAPPVTPVPPVSPVSVPTRGGDGAEAWPSPPTDAIAAVDPVAPIEPLKPVESIAPVKPVEPVKPTADQPEPERRGPQAVKPSDTIRRRPVIQPVPADEAPPAAGDLICGQCGAGNDPVRRFCRRCGASLAAAEVVAPLSWWQRFLARLRRIFGGRRYEAGYRRPVRQPIRIKGRLILLLVLGTLIAVAAFPGRGWLRTGTDLVRDGIADRVPVAPVAVRASSSAPNASAGLAIDGVGNQFWAPAKPGVADGQWIEVDLPEQVRILNLVLYGGVSAERKQFLTQARPREILVTFTSDTGKTSTKVIKLRDQPGKQQFSVRATRTVKVRFTLRSAYGVSPARRVALAELELYARE
jgi:hypothetical protein